MKFLCFYFQFLFYLIGIVDDELFVVVTTVAFVNDAKKFDVNCEASALISIDETVISGPTVIIRPIFVGAG